MTNEAAKALTRAVVKIDALLDFDPILDFDPVLDLDPALDFDPVLIFDVTDSATISTGPTRDKST